MSNAQAKKHRAVSYVRMKTPSRQSEDNSGDFFFMGVRMDNVKSIFLILAAVTLLSGCVSTKSADIFLEQKITAPKVIAIQGQRAPWVYEIERRLKKHGFQVKRMATLGVSAENVNDRKVTAYKEASARFILVVDGYAPNDTMRRCFGGGYDFNYINVELVDLKTNETVLHYSNSGFSENCPPMSGTIFGDIENMVTGAWK